MRTGGIASEGTSNGQFCVQGRAGGSKDLGGARRALAPPNEHFVRAGASARALRAIEHECRPDPEAHGRAKRVARAQASSRWACARRVVTHMAENELNSQGEPRLA